MSNIIDSIRMSGTTYAISDSGGTKVVEITQSDYDNLPTSAKTANIMYVITDAEPFDVSNYYTKDETSGATELATAFAATQPKLSAGTNITIDANNVISAEGGGGGKAIVGGRGISITTGETADTVSFNLPIYSGGTKSIKIGEDNGTLGGFYNLSVGTRNSITGEKSIVVGADNDGSNTQYSAIFGYNNTIESYKNYCVVGGQFNKLKNSYETSFGNSSSTKRKSYSFGDSGNTLFTIGNGYDWSKTHNALEVRQNGDVYIVDTSDTSTTNYYEKPMIKLQDALGGGGGTSYSAGTGIDITNDVISVTGMTAESAFTAHTADTTIHVTTAQTAAWNAKSDFSGSYNDLTDKPTIPTSTSQLTNDSGYITSSALDEYATEAYVTAATNDMATKTWVGQQGYLTQHQDISGKQDVSGMTAYTTTATTNTLSGTVTAHTADTTIHVTSAEKATWNAKSDFSGDYNDLSNKLSAGTNITIVDNVISAEGGSDINVVQTTGTSTADVMSQNAVSTQLNNKANKSAAVGGYQFGSSSDGDYIQYRNVNDSNIGNSIYYPKINGKSILTNNNIYARINYNFELVETSAITTSVTSSSTDAQVPSAKAVNDKLGGLSIVKLTQSEYDNLSTKDNSTLYVIVN